MDGFHLSDIMNNAVMNMGVQISVPDAAFDYFKHIPGSGILNGNYIFDFLRYCFPLNLLLKFP